MESRWKKTTLRVVISVLVLAQGGVLLGVDSASAEDVIMVGDVKIIVPVPDGMVRLDGKNKKYDRMAKKILSGINDLLAVYGTQNDLQAVLKGELPSQRTFNVQAKSGLESIRWSLSEFQSLKTMIKNEIGGPTGKLTPEMDRQFRKTVKSAQSHLQKETGVPVEIDLDRVTELGVFDETPESISFTTMMSAGIAVPTEPQQESTNYQGVVASAAILARNKGIYLYAMSEYEGEKDLQWTKTALSQWRAQVIAANPNADIPSNAQRKAVEKAGKSFLVWVVLIPLAIFAISIVKGYMGNEGKGKGENVDGTDALPSEKLSAPEPTKLDQQ